MLNVSKKEEKKDALKQLATLETRELYMTLRTSPQGLTHEDAKERLERYGKNEVQSQKPRSIMSLLFAGVKDPFVLVLFLLMLVSFFTKDYDAAIVMAIMISLSVMISFYQSYQSQKASLALKEMIENTATVKREGTFKEIKMEDVVPGDIVKLSTGDMIPADAVLTFTKDLFVNQSSLTGESMPVEKKAEKIKNVEEKTTLDLENVVFMGTDILSGQGEAIILKTGQATFFGDVAKSALTQRKKTPFDEGLQKVSKLLLQTVVFLFPVVFLLNGLTKGDWMSAFFFAIAVAVGLTPEMLPMIVTSNLAKGSVSLAKEKVIVKELPAIQNLGAMDVLCTDKTGTITEDRVVLVEHVDPLGQESKQVAQFAYLNSYFQTGWKNLMDTAVLEYFDATKWKMDQRHFEKIDEIPFDFSRRRLTVVLKENDKQWMITKGAVEEMLDICRYVQLNGKKESITPERLSQMKRVNQKMNEQGMRVIAVAMKENVHSQPIYQVADESDMILIGFVGFLDPAKPSAKSAIQQLQSHGVTVKVFTGDNAIVAKKVCEDVGIVVDEAIVGTQLEKMTEEQIEHALRTHHLFAKLNPMQKAYLIERLQKQGHTVGFMGDGINDAPSLRKADVGISVDTAADITKDASNIILLEKSLNVLEKGVLEGRTVFANMMKYIKITISSNFGNVFSVLVASAFLPFLPMLSLQLLVQNLIYDASQLLIPFDHVDEIERLHPSKWQLKGLVTFTLWIGPLSSIFDLATFYLMWHVLQFNTIAQQGLFQAGWFMVGLTTQVLVFHIIRTRKIPFVQSKASLSVILGSLLAILFSFFLILTPLRHALDFKALPVTYWWIYSGVVISYLVLTQVVKTIYIKKEGEWI